MMNKDFRKPLQYSKFNYNGGSYELKPLPLVENKKKIKRATMFQKNYVTLELILFCLGATIGFSAALIALMNWWS